MRSQALGKSACNIESGKTTLSAVGDHGDQKKKLQCRGLVPLYEGLEYGGSSIEEGVERPPIVEFKDPNPKSLDITLISYLVIITRLLITKHKKILTLKKVIN
jgi:hypothetical protein